MSTQAQHPRKLLIIDPAVETPEEEGASLFTQAWDGRYACLLPVLKPGDLGLLKNQIDDAGAVVILGSKASVHDDAPWITALRTAIRPVLDGSSPKPLFAICFGHQFVADACAGRVGFVNSEATKRLGIETSEVIETRIHSGGSLRVVASHEEMVVDPPAGFDTVATRDGVPHDALLHRDLPLLSTQFHPEARTAFARRQGLPEELIDTTVTADGNRLIRSFLEHAASWSI